MPADAENRHVPEPSTRRGPPLGWTDEHRREHRFSAAAKNGRQQVGTDGTHTGDILKRLRAKLNRREPIVIGGAGIGLVAKVIDRAGIDIIMACNTGPFRMDGHGSLAGCLAYGDANQITFDLAGQIRPVVENTPAVGGTGAADPRRPMDRMIDAMLAAGYSGVTNVPTAGIDDGVFRQQTDHTGIGWQHAAGRHRRARAAVRTVDAMAAAARRANPEAKLLVHGGPLESPEAVSLKLGRSDVDGYVTGSSLERGPVVAAVADRREASGRHRVDEESGPAGRSRSCRGFPAGEGLGGAAQRPFRIDHGADLPAAQNGEQPRGIGDQRRVCVGAISSIFPID